MTHIKLGDVILAFRRENHLTQNEAAALLDISRNYLSLIERGRAKNVSHALALRILNLGRSHRHIEVTLARKVFVDAAIAAEIVWLNSQGVVTEGCCKGPPPTAMIVPSSVGKALELGYIAQPCAGLYEIILKSEVKNSPLTKL